MSQNQDGTSLKKWRTSLVEELSNSSYERRKEASFILSEMGADKMSELLPFLQDSDAEIRKNIVKALMCSEEESVEKVISALLEGVEDPDWRVQGQCVIAMQKMAPDDISTVLGKLKMPIHEWVAFCLVEWITSMGLMKNKDCDSFLKCILKEEVYSIFFRTRVQNLMGESI